MKQHVLLIAPSLDIVGGQSVQASRLLAALQRIPTLEVRFQPINARLPRRLESIRFLRTVLRLLIYYPTLLARTARADILHVFTASFYSYNLWTLAGTGLREALAQENSAELSRRPGGRAYAALAYGCSDSAQDG